MNEDIDFYFDLFNRICKNCPHLSYCQDEPDDCSRYRADVNAHLKTNGGSDYGKK